MGMYTRSVEITIEVEVEFDYNAGSPGSMYAPNGDPGEPPEPEEWMIDAINVIAPADGPGEYTGPRKFADIGDMLSPSEFDQVERALNDMGMDEDNGE